MMTTFVRPADDGIRLYLDTAVQAEWDEWLPTGLFYGVTTNPLRLRDAAVAPRIDAIAGIVHAALAHGIHEVHVQTWGASADELVEHGIALAELNHRVVVKVPITRDGVAAVRRLRGRDVKTTFTALYAAHQAMTAAVVGAEYAAPYFGRIGDAGRDAVGEVIAMNDILTRHSAETRLLVASLRSANDIATLAAAGLDTFTFDARVAAELFSDRQTSSAVDAFEAAARG